MPLQFLRDHKILFWSLLVLAVAMVLAVAWSALHRFNQEMGKEDMSLKTSNSPQVAETPVPLRSRGQPEEEDLYWDEAGCNQHIVITGPYQYPRHSQQKDIQGQSDLMVSPVVDPAIYQLPAKSYHLDLSERDTEGFVQTMKAETDLR